MFKFLVIFIVFPLTVFASERAVITVLGMTIREILGFLFLLAGIFALGVLTYGGIRFVFSLGSPAAVLEAKKWVFSAFLGLIIIASSYAILRILDPRFVVIGPEIVVPAPPVLPEIIVPLPRPFYDGIVLHAHITPSHNPNQQGSENNENDEPKIEKVEILQGAFRKENLQRVFRAGEFKNFQIKKIEFKNPTDAKGGERFIQKYGIIAFEDPGFRGRCKIITKDIKELPFTPRSARSFVMPGAPHYRLGDSLIFFQESYPFRFGPVPPRLEEEDKLIKKDELKTKARLTAKTYHIGNIIPKTILRRHHQDQSQSLKKIGPPQNVPLAIPMDMENHQGLSFINVPSPSYMRFKTGDVGRYLIVLFDRGGNCYLSQESIVDLEDISRKQPAMKRPLWFQSIQILKLY